MVLFEHLHQIGLVPVIAVRNAEDAIPLCSALAEGGLPVAEITFRTAAAEESIRKVHEELPDTLLLAGTVLTPDQARRAVEAGASAVVSPGLNPTVVSYCIENNIPVCPGISSPSEIEAAMAFGLHTVKLFPAEAVGGVRMLRSLAGPYSDMRFMPTGGINENNLVDYMKQPNVICCGGSWMVPSDAVIAKDWARVMALTRSAVDRLLGLRLQRISLPNNDPEHAKQIVSFLRTMLNLPSAGNKLTLSSTDAPILTFDTGTTIDLTFCCNDLSRAMYHLTRRGFEVDRNSVIFEKGQPAIACIKSVLPGYSFRLVC